MAYAGKATLIPNGAHMAVMTRMTINGEAVMGEKMKIQANLYRLGIEVETGYASVHLLRGGDSIEVYLSDRPKGSGDSVLIPVAEFVKALGLEAIKA